MLCLHQQWTRFLALACLLLLIDHPKVAAMKSLLDSPTNTILSSSLDIARGGASSKRKSKDDPFRLVAKAIRDRLGEEMEEAIPPELEEIVDAFKDLASSQQTFKGLDGAAHEAYQRTHAGGTDEVDLSVRGRARRSAARAAATADGLGACELCELLEIPLEESASENGTLAGGRQVVLNITAADDNAVGLGKSKVSVVVLYEPVYTGGAGIFHGGIEEDKEAPSKKGKSKGRLIVIVGDDLKEDLTKCIQLLDDPPKHVRLESGLVSGEVASVQASLYKAAGSLLEVLEPTLREYENNTSAIHFVGRSLSGGIANLAAIMLDGSLPMPKKPRGKRDKAKKRQTRDVEPAPEEEEGSSTPSLNSTETSNATRIIPLSGLGQGRTSAVSLGAPPSVSANVQSEFVISIMYGDDVVCRATRASLDRLLKRSKKALNSKGWLGGKQLNMMSDAFSLTVSSLKSHAHGSEGEELRLAVPGRAYLLRPRRYGGFCSIHEVGNRLKGGREALRAHVLWQLDGILLSKSLWKHHQLDSYIHGLDRAHLRGFAEEDEE